MGVTGVTGGHGDLHAHVLYEVVLREVAPEQGLLEFGVDDLRAVGLGDDWWRLRKSLMMTKMMPPYGKVA